MVVIQRAVSDEEFRALFEPDVPAITTYQIGFALVSDDGDVEDATLGGSGTLVAIDDQLGILTAEHVVSYLLQHRKKGPVGLILPKHGQRQRHRPVFDLMPDECTVFAPNSYSARGPDLAFVPLDPETISSLKPRRDFYSLTKRRERMLDAPPEPHMGAWIISGLAGEWTADAPMQAPHTRTKMFRGITAEVQVGETETRDGLDYQSIYARVGGTSGWPESYGGFSGTGIWQMLVTQRDGKLEVAERLLSGVVFFESPPMEKDGEMVRELSCHGRQSIYGALVDAVRNKVRGGSSASPPGARQ